MRVDEVRKLALSNAERQKKSREKRRSEDLCSVPGCPVKVEGQSRCERHSTEFNEIQLRPQRLRRQEKHRVADDKTRLVTNTMAAHWTVAGLVSLLESGWLIDSIKHRERYFDQWFPLVRLFAPSRDALLPFKPVLPDWSAHVHIHYQSLRLYLQGVPTLEQHGHEPEWGKLAGLAKD